MIDNSKMRYNITVTNHGGTVRLVSKKPYRLSETKDIVSIEFEDEALTDRPTEVKEEEQ